MLTYNIDIPSGNYNLHLPNTILVHRKKQTKHFIYYKCPK